MYFPRVALSCHCNLLQGSWIHVNRSPWLLQEKNHWSCHLIKVYRRTWALQFLHKTTGKPPVNDYSTIVRWPCSARGKCSFHAVFQVVSNCFIGPISICRCLTLSSYALAWTLIVKNSVWCLPVISQRVTQYSVSPCNRVFDCFCVERGTQKQSQATSASATFKQGV